MNGQHTTTDGTVCHILPCSIDEDVTAPIAQYFHPTRLPAGALPKTKDGDATTNDDVSIIMAAQFRGRGLLCAVDAPKSFTVESTGVDDAPTNKPTDTTTLSKLPRNIMGVALSQSTTSRGATSNIAGGTGGSSMDHPPMQSLKVVETFQHVYNWRHEHDVHRVMRERHGSDKYGLNAALGWCELAREVSVSVDIYISSVDFAIFYILIHSLSCHWLILVGYLF